MTKLFFDWEKAPLLQKAADDLNSLSKARHAFCLATCFITILSLSDEDCEDIMSGSSRSQLLDELQSSVDAALLAARFIATSDLLLLQAFLLYVVTIPDLRTNKR